MRLTKPEPGKPTLVEIGDQMLELRYPLRVLKELDAEHGISLFKGDFGEVMRDPEKLIAVLHAGLKTKQPAITREWVEERVDAAMFPALWPFLLFAMSGRWSKDLVRRLADEEEDDARNPLPPPPEPPMVELLPTGSRSGASGATISGSAKPNSGS